MADILLELLEDTNDVIEEGLIGVKEAQINWVLGVDLRVELLEFVEDELDVGIYFHL